MPIHISNKKVNDIHVGTKKVLTTWIGTDRVYLASTLSMLIKGYTEKSGDSLLSANTPLKFTGENLLLVKNSFIGRATGITFSYDKNTNTYSYNGTITASSCYITIDLVDMNLDKNKSYYFVIDSSSNLQNHCAIQLTRRNVILNADIRRTYSNAIKIKNLNVGIPNAIMFYIQNATVGDVFEGNFKLTILESEMQPTDVSFEPYHETFYNPPEGFSLNGFNDIYDTFDTLSGELDKKFNTIDLSSLDWSINPGETRWRASIEGLNFKLSQNYNIEGNIISEKYPTKTNQQVGGGIFGIAVHYNYQLLFVENGSSVEKPSGLCTYELATPQTYQKKHKVLPQWVKYVFDSSGRELEATITQ